MNDDDDDDDDGSVNNNEDDEVQVIKPTKTPVNGATLMAYTMFNDGHGDEIYRLSSRIGALLQKKWSTRARQQSIEQYFKS